MEQGRAPVVDDPSGGLMALLLRLRSFGITDQDFLRVVESVPREDFVPMQFHAQAWSEEWLPTECGQSMPPAELTIQMVHWLEVKPNHAVLEIGTGSGYQTAILARLARKVRSLERYSTLVHHATGRLKRLGISNATLQQADGREGTRNDGLYDRIISECAFEDLPRVLIDQLVAGGVVVAPVGPPDGEQMLMHLTKVGSRFERLELMPVHFSPFEAGVAAAM